MQKKCQLRSFRMTLLLHACSARAGFKGGTENRVDAYLKFAVKSTRGSFHPFTCCSFSSHCPRTIRSPGRFIIIHDMYVHLSLSLFLSRKRETSENRERSLLRLATTANKHLESPELQAREDDRDSRSVWIRTGFPRKIRWGIRKISTPPQFNLLTINKNISPEGGCR